MIGRVGTIFGEHSVNIASAAVGAEESGDQAVLALTTDAPVPSRGGPGLDGDPASWTASTPAGAVRTSRVLARRSVDASGRDHPPRAAGGPSGRGAARPAGRARARSGSRSRRRGSTSPTRWPGRPLPGRARAPMRGRLRGRRRGRIGGGRGGLTQGGDRVFAGTRFSGHAELVTVPADLAFRCPRSSRSSRAPPFRSTTAPPTPRW